MKRYAHRGIHTEAVENSADAVFAAYESRADGLEVDIRRLADGTLVLHHDPGIQTGKLQDTFRDLSTLTWKEFQSYCDYRPITLKQAIEHKPPEKILVTECKPSRNARAFCRTLIKTLRKLPSENLVCSSESWKILTILSQRTTLPLAPVITDKRGINRTYLEKNLWREIHLQHELADQKEVLSRCTRYGRPIITWTVNERRRVEELRELGINGIMTDHEDLLIG